MDSTDHRRSGPAIMVMVLAALLLAVSGTPAARSATSVHSVTVPKDQNPVYLPMVYAPKTYIEWTLHKTTDSLHPDGNEQQMVWLTNRARSNPTQEGIWLATSTEQDIAGGRDYFKVSKEILMAEFASYAPKPPAAFDARLYTAAKAHSDDLVARDAQDHNGQFDRVTASGFAYSACRGNVFAYARNALNAHAAFNIDWGGGPPSYMQDGRGHRKAIMSLDGDYTNVGLAAVYVTDSRKNVGDYVVTQNFCQANSNMANHHNRFIVGTVWRDLNNNQRYDPGEGIPGVTVTPIQGDFSAVTALGGGYAVPVTKAGVYQVSFTGPVSYVTSVTVGGVSVLVDYQLPGGSSPGFAPTASPARSGQPAAPPPAMDRLNE